MKVLSIKQPYAELIVSGKKSIEIRSWNTKFRGEFLIHASLVPDKTAMIKYNFTDLPTGVIIGKSTLLDVKEYSTSQEFKKDQNKHLATTYGKCGFILTNSKRIKSIPAKGKLGFWNFD